MKIIFGLIGLLAITSCTKNHTNYFEDKKGNNYDDSSIIGKWILSATTTYVIPGGEQPWKPADPQKPVIIEFKSDSSFSFSGNFPLAYEKYDRFKMLNNYLYLYSTYSFPQNEWHPGSSIELKNNELILTHHYIDAGDEEKFTI